MPLTVGGGREDAGGWATPLCRWGNKVAVNTALWRPSFVEEAAKTFGSANVVVSIDARDTGNGRYEVYTDAAGSRPPRPDTVARRMAAAGRARF